MERQTKIITDCTLCYHSCGCEVTVNNGRAVKVQGLESHPLNKGQLCIKGENTLETVYSPDRLKTPLKKTKGGFRKIPWDIALDEIAERLLRLKAEYGPHVLGVFTGSVGVENMEIAGLNQRFKSAFGSANFFSVESVCYRMRIRTRQITFGKYPTEELDSNLYILWGHNPDASDFPLKIAIEENMKKGAKLVVIDPRRIPLSGHADMYVPIRPGTDEALALAMINVIIQEKLYDRLFIESQTTGFNRLKYHIKKFTPEWAEEITHVPANTIKKLARLFAGIKGASIYQGTCTQDQTMNGTQNSRAFSILQIITGNINVPGGWVISPRAMLNSVALNGNGPPLGANSYPLFYEVWGRTSPYGVVTMLPESIPDKLKAFLVVAGNPMVSMPDSNAFRQAFRKLDLLVVHDIFMTETGKEAHYVLPACTHLEKWGVAYNYNVCHCLPYLMLRKKCIEPLYDSWSEYRLFKELSRRLGLEDYFAWSTEEDLVSYELSATGLSFDYLLHEKPEGLYYSEKKYSHKNMLFPTLSKRIEIYSETLEKAGFDPLPSYRVDKVSTEKSIRDYPFILSTGNRDMNYTHSQHRNIVALNRKSPFPFAEISPESAKRAGIADGDDILIKTDCGEVTMKAKVDDGVSEGVVFVPHGWSGKANANLLTDTQQREPILGYPNMKSLRCCIRKVKLHQQELMASSHSSERNPPKHTLLRS